MIVGITNWATLTNGTKIEFGPRLRSENDPAWHFNTNDEVNIFNANAERLDIITIISSTPTSDVVDIVTYSGENMKMKRISSNIGAVQMWVIL